MTRFSKKTLVEHMRFSQRLYASHARRKRKVSENAYRVLDKASTVCGVLAGQIELGHLPARKADVRKMAQEVLRDLEKSGIDPMWSFDNLYNVEPEHHTKYAMWLAYELLKDTTEE